MEKVKEKATKKAKVDEFKVNPDEMLQAGLQFGHRTSRTHPKMKAYVFGVRNSIHIFDLEKTAEKLKEALEFIENLISENKILLFVGTKIQVKLPVKEIAEETGLPYVAERWLGGTITNFGVIKNRVEYFKDLENKKKAGELEKYTKKERLNFDQDLKRLKIRFEGIKEMPRIPDAIFVLDMEKDAIAVREAKKKGIKVIAICDTSVDPSLADYPIPANDDAISSVKYILGKVKIAVLKGKEKAESKKQEEKKEE